MTDQMPTGSLDFIVSLPDADRIERIKAALIERIKEKLSKPLYPKNFKEIRVLDHHRPGYVMCRADFSGQEMRIMSSLNLPRREAPSIYGWYQDYGSLHRSREQAPIRQDWSIFRELWKKRQTASVIREEWRPTVAYTHGAQTPLADRRRAQIEAIKKGFG